MRGFMKWVILAIVVGLLVWGCDLTENEPNEKINMGDIEVPDDFSYRTSDEVQVNITCQTRNGTGLNGIHFAIYDARPDDNGNLIAQGATGADGIFSQLVNLPAYYDSLTVQGFMMTVTLPIVNNLVEFDTRFPDEGVTRSKRIASSYKSRDITFEYLQDYDSNGIPLDMSSDEISAEFLERINASLPERSPVPTYHPDYLQAGSVLNVEIEAQAEVWITFVHEGAGYRNSLGFYTYNIDDGPPENPDSLEHTVIFPNASIGWNLLSSGDKVYLGTFEAGTVIGWFLVANGWRDQVVSDASVRYYSNPEYNPEWEDLYKQHTILLYDDDEDKLLLAFEDLTRPGGDNDFNDAVFYVTADPIEAVNIVNVNPIDVVDDADEDGISDVYDDYPDDPTRAFDNYYPAENVFGTLAFEDSWPRQGDYDLNDLVMEYNFHNVHDPNNKLIEINATTKVVAIGAAYHNGFAIEMPFENSLIESFTEGEWTEEETADNAIVKVFHDAYDLIDPPGEGFINTEPEYSYYQPVTDTFSIVLINGIALEDLDYMPPYNPFLRVNGNYNKEVHLVDYPPTSMADQSYFQTEDDDSNPAAGRYYKTVNNLPWAISIPEPWSYPIERSEVSWGYLVFPDWAESSGAVYNDWFQMNEVWIDEDHIYITP